MDGPTGVLVVGGAVSAWLVLAAATALLAGRVIHERDVHDRPAVRTRIRVAARRR